MLNGKLNYTNACRRLSIANMWPIQQQAIKTHIHIYVVCRGRDGSGMRKTSQLSTCLTIYVVRLNHNITELVPWIMSLLNWFLSRFLFTHDECFGCRHIRDGLQGEYATYECVDIASSFCTDRCKAIHSTSSTTFACESDWMWTFKHRACHYTHRSYFTRRVYSLRANPWNSWRQWNCRAHHFDCVVFLFVRRKSREINRKLPFRTFRLFANFHTVRFPVSPYQLFFILVHSCSIVTCYFLLAFLLRVVPPLSFRVVLCVYSYKNG